MMTYTDHTWCLLLPPFSPYRTRVKPSVEPSRVKVSGAGVSGKGIPASLPTELLIDTSDAGAADLKVSVTVSTGTTVNIDWLLSFVFGLKVYDCILQT